MAKKPCAGGCAVRLAASPKVQHWTSPEQLHADLAVRVTVHGHELSPTYYHRGHELCVGYFSGYGATAKVNVCGEPYRVRVTAQAFKRGTPLQVHYKAFYASAARSASSAGPWHRRAHPAFSPGA